MSVTAHVVQTDTNRSSTIDGRFIRHSGYGVSQIERMGIEERFGWLKISGRLRKSRFIGREKLGFRFVVAFAAFNLTRTRNVGVGSC